jgi:lipopolysaccharide transport system ATP-binding protein
LRWGSGEIEIAGVDFLDRRGRPADVFETGGPLTVRIRYTAHRPIEEPVFGLAIHHESGFHINGPNTRFGGLALGTLEGAGHLDYTIPELPLLAGGYLLTAAVYDRSLSHAFDHHERMYRFVVQTNRVAERFGTVHIPGEWRWTSG